MSKSGLSQQVDAYHAWKNNLKEEIGLYQDWLSENHLDSDDVHQSLARGLNLLKQDELTIAFVGEYSRGKTELINSLVFSEFGQRMLPSQAGRTTMCPTEVFFDQERQSCYLRLLPIETRMQGKSISEYKDDPSAWHEIEIDVNDPKQMSFSLQQVASTRSANIAEARALGFDESMLDHDPNEAGKVIIPVWRHALISLDNPMLKKGLRILDTPGLNALGSEPELSISMIPKAQAVVFILSADTGVTASDMAIWNDYIDTPDADHRAGRFAVLNKIDVLWDDLQGDMHTAASIERVRKNTADKLEISHEDVIPLSAKQGLIARVKGDDLLLKKSALSKLEKLISKRILEQKETLLSEALVNDVVAMLARSQAILKDRLIKLHKRYSACSNFTTNIEVLQELADKTHQDHDEYYKKLIALKSSRRLMQSQGEILQQLMAPQNLEALLKETKNSMQHSWSTVAMTREMHAFLKRIEADIANISTEAKMAEKMVSAIYQRFTVEDTSLRFKHKEFAIKAQKKRIRELKLKLVRFCRNPKMFMMEQTILIKHFFDTFVGEVKDIHLNILEEAKRWPDEALLPLMQYTLEQKQMLEKQVSDLREMASSNKSAQDQKEALKDLMDRTHAQLKKAEAIQAHLQEPPPGAEHWHMAN